MARFKNVDGENIRMTEKEELDFLNEIRESNKPPTPAELDNRADEMAKYMTEEKKEYEALFDVMADIAAEAGLAQNPAAAKAEIKKRFRDYYRGKL